MTYGGVSDIEKGRVKTVNDRTIKLIISEFGVSEIWLRTGEGEMFPPEDSRAARLNAWLNTGNDLFLKEVIYALTTLPPDTARELEAFIYDIIDGHKRKQAAEATANPDQEDAAADPENQQDSPPCGSEDDA